MNKWAAYVNAETGEVIDSLPDGAILDDFEPGKHKMPDWRNRPKAKDTNWAQLALAGGGGLLAHSIAASLFDDDEETRKNESVWRKLLRILAPIGAGAAGAYGGYMLGKSAQARRPIFYDSEAAKMKAEANSSAFPWNLGAYAGAAGSGYYAAKNARDWYRIASARKKLPIVDAEIAALEGKTSGTGAAASRMAENRMGKILSRFNARSVADAAGATKDMAEISQLDRFAKKMQTPSASTVDMLNLEDAIARRKAIKTVANGSKKWAVGKTGAGIAGTLGSLALGSWLNSMAEKNEAIAKGMEEK